MIARGLALMAALALVPGCEKQSPVVAGFDPGPVPAKLAAGEQAFNRNCSACHGVFGAGSEAGPPLVHVIYEPNHHSDEAFRRAVSLGVAPHHWSFGRMPPVAGLRSEDVEAIIKYVRWLQQKGGII